MSAAKPRIAIIGAGGFVGARLVERWHLTGHADVIGIVRRPAALARLARFAVAWRLADACDEVSLAAALQGCDGVVHAVTGDPPAIRAAARALARAARRAGVPRTVYLSSAMVHGPAPAADFDETAPLARDQGFDYGRAKIAAEEALVASGLPGLIRLRPGIVYGPRSRWITDPLQQLTTGPVPWIEGGRGVCPAIYVDNLIDAIECALASRSSAGHAYLVRDTEAVTWRDFLLGVLGGFGLDERATIEGRPTEPASGWRRSLDALRGQAATQWMLARVPGRWKLAVKGALAGFAGRSSFLPSAAEPGLAPATHGCVDAERTSLQRCRGRMLDARARAELGYAPAVSFNEGMRRAVAWARFAGWDEAQFRGARTDGARHA